MFKVRSPISQFLNAKQLAHGSKSLGALKGLQATKVAVILSKSIANDSEKVDYIKNNINCHSLKLITRSWDDEPSTDNIDVSLNQINNFQPDCIVAIGGGSVIDGAKILWTFYEHPELKRNMQIDFLKVPKLRGKCFFVSVPTTVGTGSEVSSSAIILNKVNNKKIPIVSNDYISDIVILDSKLVLGIPNSILVSTAIDACSHAIEGYVSKIQNQLMDNFAMLSLKVIFDNIFGVLEDSENEKKITELQYASMMAGWVQNHCLVGLSHALAHQMGGFKMGHGIANSIFLSESIIYNSKDPEVFQKYEKLSKFCGYHDGIDELIAKINNLVSKGAFSIKLREYGIKKTHFKKIINEALDDPAGKYNPVELEREKLNLILEKKY